MTHQTRPRKCGYTTLSGDGGPTGERREVDIHSQRSPHRPPLHGMPSHVSYFVLCSKPILTIEAYYLL
jgi:hypothetical protein